LHYPAAWDRPLAIGFILAAILLIVWLSRREPATLWMRLAGIGAVLVIVVCAVAPVLALGSWMLTWPSVRAALVSGDLPQGRWFLAGFSALALAGQAGAWALLRRQSSLTNLTNAGLMVWIMLLAGACAFLPAACCLLIWPLFWGGLAIAGAVLRGRPQLASRRKQALALAACWLGTVAVVVHTAPLIY